MKALKPCNSTLIRVSLVHSFYYFQFSLLLLVFSIVFSVFSPRFFLKNRQFIWYEHKANIFHSKRSKPFMEAQKFCWNFSMRNFIANPMHKKRIWFCAFFLKKTSYYLSWNSHFFYIYSQYFLLVFKIEFFLFLYCDN